MSKSRHLAGDMHRLAEASKQRMGPTPLRPLTHAYQNASLPMPLGATTPTPVTQTLRMASLHRTQRRSCCPAPDLNYHPIRSYIYYLAIAYVKAWPSQSGLQSETSTLFLTVWKASPPSAKSSRHESRRRFIR